MKKTADPARQQRKREAALSVSEAQQAIYIDFEGFEDKPPSMIGVFVGEAFEQVVFDPALHLAAEHSNMMFVEACVFLQALVGKAQTERRRIVAYSSHEKNVFQSFFGIDIQGVYADARLIAKRLRIGLPKDMPKPKGLKDYLELIGYYRPKVLGERQTTQRLRAVADQLARKKNFEELTPTVKSKWSKVLSHNRHDVFGMREVVLKALSCSPPGQ